MSKKNGDAIPVIKHYDQMVAMFEEAEIDFDEGVDSDSIQSIDMQGTIFEFDETGSLMGVRND